MSCQALKVKDLVTKRGPPGILMCLINEVWGTFGVHDFIHDFFVTFRLEFSVFQILIIFSQQQQQPATPNTPQQPPQQQKEINTAMVCRIGQESVQDIISRTHEVFSYLRVLQVHTYSTLQVFVNFCPFTSEFLT